MTILTTNNKEFYELLELVWYKLPINMVLKKEDETLCRDLYQMNNWETWYSEVDVREVIFSKEFQSKFSILMHKKDLLWFVDYKHNIFEHLDNPVKYLLNIVT